MPETSRQPTNNDQPPRLLPIILAGASTALPLQLFAEFCQRADLTLILVVGMALCQTTFAAYLLVHARWNLIWRAIWFVSAIGHAGYTVSNFELGGWRETGYLTFFVLIALISTVVFASYQISRWRAEGTLQFTISTLFTITTTVAILLGAGLSVGWVSPPKFAYAIAITTGIGGAFAGELGRRWYQPEIRRILLQCVFIGFGFTFAYDYSTIALFACVIQTVWMFVCCLSTTRVFASSEAADSEPKPKS